MADTTTPDARAAYAHSRLTRQEEADALGRSAGAISTARLVCALAAIVLSGCVVWGPLPRPAWAGVALLVAVFFSLVVVHAQVFARKDRADAAVRYHERGLLRLAGKWTEFPSTGDRFLAEAASHAFADDLDVFGKGSLFQLLDETATRRGESTLATWLMGSLEKEPASRTRARQAAIRELSTMLELREKLAVSGAMLGDKKPDVSGFASWAGASEGRAPGNVRAVAFVVPAVTVSLVVLGQLGYVPWWSLFFPLALGLFLTRAFRSRVDASLSVAATKETALGRYGEMLAKLENASFISPELSALCDRLRATGASATQEMASLGRIVGFVDARENEFFRLFVGPALLWDVHCANALEGWRARAGKGVAEWFSALAEMEAYASLATFAFEHPDFAFPELVAEPLFEAKALAHPLLDAGKRVANDVRFEGPGTGLIVTGSNMSGKSTLLRAIGANAVLARVGAPVCAESLRIGPLMVVTSMRVRDSLSEGVSRFYAELKKLKVVLALCRAAQGRQGEGGATVLFLLDEILHGTNTRERLIGARALVRELLACGAMGAVSTHDLGLGDLEEELGGRVRNVHFEEQVTGGEMTFDYRLRPGVVTSSNALRLMQMVGLDVIKSD